MPQGLADEGGDERVQFERRRDRETKRKKSAKSKHTQDKDWVLKKKDVCTLRLMVQDPCSRASSSFIENEGKKACPAIPNTRHVRGNQYSDSVRFTRARISKSIYRVQLETMRYRSV